MATSSEPAEVDQIWNNSSELLTEWDSRYGPKRLKIFCDAMVHSFQYEGDYFPPAVFRCHDKVTAWGLEWVESSANKIQICPKMKYKDRGHLTTGLNVVDMQGLDHYTALLIVDEVIPKSDESVHYELILDYSKMEMDLCETITQQGMLNKTNNSDFWAPHNVKDEWDIIDKQRQAKSAPSDIAAMTPAVPSPVKKTSKRKAIVGAPGDEVPVEGSQKKKRKTKSTPLTIQVAVNLTDTQINKLTETEMKAMNKLYQDVFMPLYKWEKKPLADSQGRLLRVHYKFLHKDEHGRLVYRGIEQSRLKKIKNRILVDADYNSENRYITVYPLKIGPCGPDNTPKYFDTCPKKEQLTTTTHYFIIGGQHTVEAHRLLIESGDIPERDKFKASTFNVIPIWQKFDLKNNDVVHLSRALNQNIVGEQREQNFTKQLLHCRLKWKDVGSPQPSLYGRAHSAKFSAFCPIVSTIFTGVKGSDAADLKIPLLFMKDDVDVARWVEIEGRYLLGSLPDGLGMNSKAIRKPFSKNDFKPLYGFRTEDINYLAELVEKGTVCMKTCKPGSSWNGLPVVSLKDAGARERQIRAMKNELMNFYLQHPLPSKQPDYVAYSAAEWDKFAADKKISRDDLELWVDKSLATEMGKDWLAGRLKGLNKTSDPNDCREAVKSMWRAFMGVHAQEAVEAVAVQAFETKYCCYEMDENTWDISSILANTDVMSWRGSGKTHIYFWFMFENSRVGPQAKVLENHKLKRLIDALEYRDLSTQVIQARSPAVLITDAQGFHSILCHLQRRFEQSRRRVWDWHVVNYIPEGCDGFPRPFIGSSYNVFIVFLFGHDEDHGATAAFHSFFPGLEDVKALYKSSEMEDMETCFKRKPKPWFKIMSAVNIFGALNFKDAVLVNVNGTAEFTFLGIWAGYKVLEVVDSAESRTVALTLARQIWDQFTRPHPKSDSEVEEENSDEVGEKTDDEADVEDEAVEREVDVHRDSQEETDVEVDGHVDEDNEVDEANPMGVEGLHKKGNAEEPQEIDTSETDDDLPPTRQSITADVQFEIVPRQAAEEARRHTKFKASRPPLPNVGKGRDGRGKKGRGTGTAASPSKSSRSIGSSRDGARELRTKRILDFPENDFDLDNSSRDRRDGNQIDSVVMEHASSEDPTEDPYSFNDNVGDVGTDQSLGTSSGDLQMSQKALGVLHGYTSGSQSHDDLHDWTGDVVGSSEDLQMHSGQAVVALGESANTPQHGEHSVDFLEDTRTHDDKISSKTGKLSPALPVSAETSGLHCDSDGASRSLDIIHTSGNLLMGSELLASGAGDMTKNIVNDTLLDLNPMSPEAELGKEHTKLDNPVPDVGGDKGASGSSDLPSCLPQEVEEVLC